MTAAALKFADLRVFRETHGVDQRVVIDGLDLMLPAGERLVLAGPNGAGKTSLLLAAVGALPYTGHIEVDGVLLSPKTLTPIRRRVGLVFADPSEQFFLPTVYEEVAFAPRKQKLHEADVEERARQALNAVNLSGFERRAPSALSLGEQRRLAIACVLAMQPGAMLLDEPTASLDPRARRAILDVILRVDATVIIATHDLDAALEIESHVALLDSGRLVAQGRAAEILADGELLTRAGLDYPLSIAALRRKNGA